MKKKTSALFSQAGAVVAVFLLVLCSACQANAKATSSVASTANLTSSPFSSYGNISANVFGLANFEGYSQTFSYPIQFTMPPISIAWMGNIFNGLLNGAGAGGNTTYQVHGSLSSSGEWIDSMVYSMEVKANSGIAAFYRVTLQNIPLTKSFDAQGNPQWVCTKNSSDVQRFVSKIEYINTGGFTYVGTDLADPWCVAKLGVSLATGLGIASTDGTPGGLLGQGMM